MLDIDQIITHPDFRLGSMSNPHDIGMLILGEPVGDIIPATLPAEGLLDQLKSEGKLRQGSEGAKFTVVGYGTTSEWPPPKIIEPDGKRRFAVSEFLNLRKVWLHVSQNRAPGRENSGACYGDSGGPVFWTEPDGTKILVAVTSWGDNKCVATTTNYRVDIPEVLSFINDEMSNLILSAPAATANRLTTTWGHVKSGF